MNNFDDIQFGLDTFGDMTVAIDGTPDSAAQVIRNIVAQAVLADELGIDAFNGHVSLPHVGMVVLAALGYSIAPVIANQKMPNVSGVAINGLAMAMVAVFYAIPALGALPKELAANPPIEAWASLLGLGVICSALAFVAFFRLTREIDVARASLVTYMNMAVAVFLGIILLAEPITAGILIGFPLVVVGSILATRKHV